MYVVTFSICVIRNYNLKFNKTLQLQTPVMLSSFHSLRLDLFAVLTGVRWMFDISLLSLPAVDRLGCNVLAWSWRVVSR